MGVTTDSEGCVLLGSSQTQEEKEVGDEATIEGESAVSTAGDTEAIRSEDESLDAELRLYAKVQTASSDAENSSGTAVTTELQQSKPMKSKPAEKSTDDQQSDLPVATATVASEMSQLVDSTTGSTDRLEQSIKSKLFKILSENKIADLVAPVPVAPRPKFVVVAAASKHKLPGAQLDTNVQMEGSVPMIKTTDKPPNPLYPYSSQSAVYGASRPVNANLIPTLSARVGTPYSVQFSGPRQTTSAVKTAAPGWKGVAGSAPAVQTMYPTSNSLGQGYHTSSQISYPTYPPASAIKSSIQPAPSTSIVQMRMPSNLPAFRTPAASAAYCPPNTVQNAVLPNATNTEQVATEGNTHIRKETTPHRSSTSRESLHPYQQSHLNNARTRNQNTNLLHQQVPRSSVVTGGSTFMTQQTEEQPLDLSSGFQSRHLPSIPLRQPRPCCVPPYATQRHALPTGALPFVHSQFVASRPSAGFRESSPLIPQSGSAPGTINPTSYPTIPSLLVPLTPNTGVANLNGRLAVGTVMQPFSANASGPLAMPMTPADSVLSNNRSSVPRRRLSPCTDAVVPESVLPIDTDRGSD